MDPILKLLKEDASLSPATIAGRLGKTEDEVVKAIKGFESDHVILGYRTLVNEDLMGLNRVRAVIEVKTTPEREGGFNRIATRVAKFDQVRSCYLMSGSYDLMVIVEGSGLHEVASFVAEKLATLEGVISTATHFMLKPYKEHGVLMHHDENPDRLKVTP
ncbi:Lrp/AsnC family transcriptional regulator [Verrucomicrobia bacterium]|jgi:DNA-binding Lrp family transcriptional regulator|nr:Lrp/AsnC family transcriptional regulator [Verrucomicrobiota bacterium]MDA7657064.1 Lrp/AsnC family transcriptional regulator [Verrucomicrobiota bacterium]